MCLKTIIRQS